MTPVKGGLSISAGMVALLGFLLAAISGVVGASVSYGRDYGQLVQKVDSHDRQISNIDKKLDQVISLLVENGKR